MKKIYNILLLFIFIGLSSVSFGQTASSNCDLGDAGAEISVGSSCSFTPWESSNSSDYWNSASGCGATDYDDAWGWFTATGTSTTITYSPDAGYDAILSLFTGACATSLSSIACADDAGSGGDETITYATTIGTIYMVRIQEYWGSGSMFGDICVYSGGGGCTNIDSYGSATAPSDNNAIIIETCNYQNEYNTISGVVAGNTYQSGSDCGGYITVRSGTSGGAVVASGNAPLSWTATVSGTHYIHYNTNSSCGTASNCCTTTLTCTSCSAPTPTCSDGIQNGDETAVDCGGTVCNPCIVPAEVCEDANPFCSDLVYNFPTTVDAGDAVVGPDYGCLGDQPNPVWYYLLVDANGDLEIEIASDCGDVDYAAWGPFSSTTCDNSDLTTSGNFMYEWYGASTTSQVDAFSAPSGNMVDCSYDIDAVEYLYIPNAVIGEYYVVLITNYDNCDGLLTFSQISGSGSSNCNIVLPVKLMSFTAKAMENYNILNWQTATEVNNDYFVVESSTDMINFKEIGRVDGAGNSNNVISYQYLDYTSFDKVIYYRLKQVDFDGVYTFSDIVAVKKSNEGDVNIYPNPAKEALFLDVNSKEEAVYTIRYVNVLGATVQEKLVVAEGNNTYQLTEFKQLNSGIYFVQLINDNNEVIKYQKIVKE